MIVWEGDQGWTPEYLQKMIDHHRTLARGNDHIADDYEKALTAAIIERESYVPPIPIEE